MSGLYGPSLDALAFDVRNRRRPLGSSQLKALLMPKASLVALLAASAITVIPFNLFAQAAAAPGTQPAAPSAAPTAETKAVPPAVDAETTPQPEGDLEPATPPSAAHSAPAAAAPAPTGPLLPGMAMGAAEPVSVNQPKSSAAANDAKSESILAEDWWSHSRPIIEMHGYFRTRAELFHNFSLGRMNSPATSLWPLPTDNSYTSLGAGRAQYGSDVCTSAGASASTTTGCSNKYNSSANLRLRLNPEIHVSDNLRIMTQIDLLDNLVYGSTPSGYTNIPAAGGGYAAFTRNGYTALSFFDNTTEPPSSGVNGFKDSVRVKRAWAEYSTPVGQLRFGRMPDHFGLGMLHNSGDGYDHDYQSTIDRIMFMTDIRPLDLYIGGGWDFPNSGKTSESLQNLSGQPYNVSQLSNVRQYSLIVMRKKNPQLERMTLTRGDMVLNFGAYVQYRSQYLANDATVTTSGTSAGNCAGIGGDCNTGVNQYVRRNASAWTPDIWVQLMYKHFRFEAEAATIQGSIDSIATNPADRTNYLEAPGKQGWRLNAWGVATQLQQRLLEDKLDLSFGFGWASGDPNVNRTGTGANEGADMGLTPGNSGIQNPRGSNTFSTFRFNPSYQMDLILHRNLLTRVQGTYYFRPSIGYDFLRKPNGQRLGGNVAGIWTRASEYMQAPGHARDLGIEVNGSVYYQSKDGVLNDRAGSMGGFFTMLQYGVLFPLDGLGYPEKVTGGSTSAAQILRWYLGVFF